MPQSSLTDHLGLAASGALPILLDAAIKSLAVLALTVFITFTLRRASAASRHLVWLLGMASLLVLPILSATLPAWHVLPAWAMPQALGVAASTTDHAQSAIEPPSSPSPHRAGTDGMVRVQISPEILAPVAPFGPRTDRSPRRPAAPAPEAPSVSASRLPWQFWVLLAWAIGCVLLLARIALGVASLRRLDRRSTPIRGESWLALLRELSAQLGLRRRVELLSGPHRAMPMVWGIRHVRLLLPADSSEWTDEQRRAVLLHELAHAERGDCLSQLLAHCIRALYWFNPLAWLATSRMATEREMACDDLVLRGGARPSAYAEQLLHIAAEMPMRGASAAIAMARPTALERRIRAILDAGRSRKSVTIAAALLAVAALLAITAGIATIHARIAAATSHPTPFQLAETMEMQAAVEAQVQAESNYNAALPLKDQPDKLRAMAGPETVARLDPEGQTLREQLGDVELQLDLLARKGYLPNAPMCVQCQAMADELKRNLIHSDRAFASAYIAELNRKKENAEAAAQRFPGAPPPQLPQVQTDTAPAIPLDADDHGQRDNGRLAKMEQLKEKREILQHLLDKVDQVKQLLGYAAIDANGDAEKVRKLADPQIISQLDPEGEKARAQRADAQSQLDLLLRQGNAPDAPAVKQNLDLIESLNRAIKVSDQKFVAAFIKKCYEDQMYFETLAAQIQNEISVVSAATQPATEASTASLVVHFLDVHNQPLRREEISLVPASIGYSPVIERGQYSADDAGIATIRGLVPGRHRFVANTDWPQPTFVDVDVPPGGLTTDARVAPLDETAPRPDLNLEPTVERKDGHCLLHLHITSNTDRSYTLDKNDLSMDTWDYRIFPPASQLHAGQTVPAKGKGALDLTVDWNAYVHDGLWCSRRGEMIEERGQPYPPDPKDEYYRVFVANNGSIQFALPRPANQPPSELHSMKFPRVPLDGPPAAAPATLPSPAAQQPADHQAALPSAAVRVLSTPEEIARGQFHWLVTPSSPVFLCLRCDLLENDGKSLFPGGGQSIPLAEGRPTEIVGSLQTNGGKVVLHVRGYYPAPHDVPALFDITDTEYFGSENGDAFAKAIQRAGLTQFTGDYAPFAWAPRQRAGNPAGTAFCIARLASPKIATPAAAVPPLAVYQVPAAKASGAQPAVNPWRTQLPCGVAVELVGVSTNPSSDHSWWRPDGSPMAHPPAHAPSPSDVGTAAAPAYQFALFVDNVPFAHFGDYQIIDKIDAHPTAVDGLISGSGNWFSRPSDDLKVMPIMHLILQSFSPLENHTTIWLGVSAGEWKTVADDLTDGKADSMSRMGINGTNIDVSFTAPYEAPWSPQQVKDPATFINAAQNLPPDQQVRIVAILASGKEVVSGMPPLVTDGHVHQVTSSFRNVAIKDVKLFRLESRPFQWTQFKDIPLRPAVGKGG
jgi:beta-lactamase regulating signal transducer with metallopeptidase domain